MSVVLSLDVSSSCTGWSVLKRGTVYYGAIPISKNLSLAEKLTLLRKELSIVLAFYKPTKVVIEDVFIGPNKDVGIVLARFGGVAVQTVHEKCKVEPFIVSNRTVKSFFSVRTKEKLFDIINKMFNFKKFSFDTHNDIVDSIAQLIYYCSEELALFSCRKKAKYGYLFNLSNLKLFKEHTNAKSKRN